jgi:hypothetical protein
MKRFLVVLIVTCLVLCAIGYGLYRFYLPGIIAKAIIAEDTPSYIPKRLMNKVDEFRAPVQKGADEMVIQLKRNNIPLDKALELVENTNEEVANNFLEELNASNPKSTNEVFNIAKKHLSADFDLEVFRDAFVQNVNMKTIHKAMNYANTNQRTKDLDIETGREIVKQILIEKFKEADLKEKSN